MKTSSTKSSILTLGLGSMIAQTIPIAASLLLARLYSVEQYGEWGLFSSIAGMLAIIILGQYETAVVRPEKEQDAESIVQLTFLIGLSGTIFLYLLILAAELFHIEAIKTLPGLYLIPIFSLSIQLLQLYNNYANRKERYKVLAVSGIMRNGWQTFIRIVSGLIKCNAGLILGAVGGTIAANIYSEKRTPIKQLLYKNIDKGRIKAVAKRYRYFPMFQLPGALLNTLSWNLPVILLTYYFDTEHVGFYSMTIGILYLPVQFISNAMGKVFYKKAADQTTQSEVVPLAVNILKIAFVIGLLINILIIGWGESLFGFFLGSKWTLSGTYAAYFAPWIWMNLCFAPLGMIFDAKDKQNREFLLNILLFTLRVSAVVIGGSLLQSATDTMKLYGISCLISWIVNGIVVYKTIHIRATKNQIAAFIVPLLIVLLAWGSKLMA